MRLVFSSSGCWLLKKSWREQETDRQRGKTGDGWMWGDHMKVMCSLLSQLMKCHIQEAT